MQSRQKLCAQVRLVVGSTKGILEGRVVSEWCPVGCKCKEGTDRHIQQSRLVFGVSA
jgi:hypothetical protein